MVSVCFVCLGNICRSPTAEGVLRHLVREAGLESEVARRQRRNRQAGTSGDSPDWRACAAGKRRGIEIAGAARQFKRADFARFDYVSRWTARTSTTSPSSRRTPRPRKSSTSCARSIPASRRTLRCRIPYYGGAAGFDEVVELCLAACRPLLERIRKEHAPVSARDMRSTKPSATRSNARSVRRREQRGASRAATSTTRSK